MEQYMLVIYDNMEQETHTYDSIEELLEDWHKKSIEEFNSEIYDWEIFKVFKIAEKEND